MKRPGQDLTYIIPYRKTSDENRERNLRFVLGWVSRKLPESKIVVVEQDKKPSYVPAENVGHMFIENDGPFNKAWALNCAAVRAETKKLAFGDCDIVLRDEVLYHSLQFLETCEAVSSYQKGIVYLSEEESASARSKEEPSQWAFAPRSRPPRAMHIPFAAGLFFIRKSGFEKVGGWDEEFEGWGGEDDAMSHKIKNLLPWVWLDHPAYHLYHKPADVVKEEHQKNIFTLNTILSIPQISLSIYAKQNLEKIGNPLLYQRGLERTKL